MINTVKNSFTENSPDDVFVVEGEWKVRGISPRAAGRFSFKWSLKKVLRFLELLFLIIKIPNADCAELER